MIVRVQPARPSAEPVPAVDVVYVPERPAPPRSEPQVMGVRLGAAHITPLKW